MLEAEQGAAHALSWIATYSECLKQLSNWADALSAEGKLGEMEGLILQIGAGEYLAQLRGGLMMSQGEMARLTDVGVDPSVISGAAIDALIANGATDAAKKRLVELMIEAEGSPVTALPALRKNSRWCATSSAGSRTKRSAPSPMNGT